MIEKLEGTHETVNYRENTNLRIYDNVEYEEYPMHWHSPLEIVMPVKHNYRVEYADTAVTLREGDILAVCPAVLHPNSDGCTIPKEPQQNYSVR